MKRTRVLYLEVADKLKEDIFSGKYPVGSMLPTENELEELFDVSKITIRKAIELLAADEYVEKKSGRGTTVLSNRPYNRLAKAASFTQILEESHLKVRKETIDLRRIPLESDHPLSADYGKEALLFERLYFLDEHPYIYFKHYLPIQMEKFSKEEFAQESLYRLMTQTGYAIQSFEDDFAAVQLTPAEQKILKTDETIGIKRIRKSITEAKQVIEYSEALYNTNLHPYRIDYEA
jgi:GntR family transcriptional regulator